MIEDFFNGNDPALFLFDMDHTLINNDCDVSWKQFLVNEGVAPGESLVEAQRFYDDYVRGELDISEFLQFQFKEFRGNTPNEMKELSQLHFDKVVKKKIYPYFIDLLNELNERNIPRAIVTATNEIVAQPVAEYLHIPTLLSTKLAVSDNRFTGDIAGKYCYSEVKVNVASDLAAELSISFDNCAYYGDSLSDIPLLKQVKYPILVNPNKHVVEVIGGEEFKIIKL